MTTPRPPVVLVVDDEPDDQRRVFTPPEQSSATYKVLHPEEVTGEALNEADLVLVDYVLNNWDSRNSVGPIALRPPNGIALASVLREHAGSLKRPTGFAMHTGQPDRLWLTPAEPRRHLIARAYNLEWVFLKSEPADVLKQAPILGAAVRRLPQSWPTDDHGKALSNLRDLLEMGRPDDDRTPAWASTAMADVEGCHPPLTELSERNHGLVFLRWLLQRILPYPCFLLAPHRLAARLRITLPSLEAALKAGLGAALAPTEYRGVLAGFSGSRWWRAGVEDWLWGIAGSVTLPPRVLRDKVAAIAGVELTPTASESPIVCIDENYKVLPEAAQPASVVRIQPDDWPGFASQAWTTIELAKAHPKLGALVVSEDQEKLAAAVPIKAGVVDE